MKYNFLFLILIIHCGSGDFEILYDKGFEAREAGKYSEAKRYYKDAAKLKKTPALYKELGNVYFLADHNLLKAQSYYLKSLSLDPEYINAIYNMAMINLELYKDSMAKSKKEKGKSKYLKNAKKWLKKSDQVSPKFYLTIARWGEYYFHKKKYKKALKKIDQSIAKNDEDPINLYLKALVYHNGLKKSKKALPLLRESLSLSEQYLPSLDMIRFVYLELKQEKKAVKFNNKYIKLLKKKKMKSSIIKDQKVLFSEALTKKK